MLATAEEVVGDMYAFALLTWLAVGLGLAIAQLYLFRSRLPPGMLMFVGATSALIAGLVSERTTRGLWMVGEYNLVSLMLAGLVAALVLVSQEAFGRRHVGGSKR